MLSAISDLPRYVKFLIVIVFLLIAYFVVSQMRQAQVLAYVGEDSITKQFLRNKIADECLALRSDMQATALEKWIDFLVLKQGAKELGIDTSEEGVKKLVDQQSVPKAKTCPEQFQRIFLKDAVSRTILYSRSVEHLIALPDMQKALEKLVSNYDAKKYLTLADAAKEFLPSEGYYMFDLLVTSDSKKEGLYADPIMLNTIFSLKDGQVSKAFSLNDGTKTGKVAVVKVTNSKNNTSGFASFDEWYASVELKTSVTYVTYAQ